MLLPVCPDMRSIVLIEIRGLYLRTIVEILMFWPFLEINGNLPANSMVQSQLLPSKRLLLYFVFLFPRPTTQGLQCPLVTHESTS